MNCPIELPVYEAGTEIGTLRADRAGLYYRFTCCCQPPMASMSRLYAIDGLQTAPLGLLMPDGGAFVLEKSVSAHSFPLADVKIAVAGLPLAPHILPWRGEIDGVPIEHAWLEPVQEGYALYVPSEEAFPLPADLEEAEPTEVGGIACLRLLLDAEGDPVHTHTE